MILEVTPTYDPFGRQVCPDIAGCRKINISYFEKKLGKTAFRIWLDMVKYRSPDGGLFHGTLANVADRIGKSKNAVELAIRRRLKPAGLIVDYGFGVLRVFKQWTPTERKVYIRTVYGQIISEKHVVVPEKTLEWLKSAESHGGIRYCSGPSPVSKYAISASDRESRTSDRGYERLSIEQVILQNLHLEKTQVTGSRASDRVENASQATGVYTSIEDHASTEYSCSFATGTRGGKPPASTGDFRSESSTKRGNLVNMSTASKKSSSRPNPAFKDWKSRVLKSSPIPPFPGATVVGSATKPIPPQFPPDLSNDDLVRVLITVYNSACKARLGIPAYSYRAYLKPHANMSKMRNYKSLLAAAKLMQEHKISPWGWAAWTLDFRKKDFEDRKPQITEIFSRRTLEKPGGRHLYKKNSINYGRNAFISDPHRKLIERYYAMERNFRRRDVTDEDLPGIIAEHFPPGDWAIAVDEVRRLIDAKRESYEAALRDGVFIW